MKNSKLVLVLSLVGIATVAAHAGKPANGNAIIASSPESAIDVTPPQDDKPAGKIFALPVRRLVDCLRALPRRRTTKG